MSLKCVSLPACLLASFFSEEEKGASVSVAEPSQAELPIRARCALSIRLIPSSFPSCLLFLDCHRKGPAPVCERAVGRKGIPFFPNCVVVVAVEKAAATCSVGKRRYLPAPNLVGISLEAVSFLSYCFCGVLLFLCVCLSFGLQRCCESKASTELTWRIVSTRNLRTQEGVRN